MEKIQKENLALLEQQKQLEMKSVTDGLNAALQEDILTLQLQHKRQVAIEEEKFNKQYASLQQSVDDFFDSEMSALNSLMHRSGKEDRAAAKKKAAESAKLRDYLFGGNRLPRLIALAQYLDSNAFLNTCIEQAAVHLSSTCSIPEWRCKAISSQSFAKLLGSIDSKTAVQISHRRDCSFPKDLTEKDLMMRRKVAEHELAKHSAVALRHIAAAKEHPFPELVDEELEKRRTSHAPVFVDETKAPPSATLGPKLLTVTTNKVHKYVTVHATRARSHAEDGMWYCEALILGLDPLSGDTAAVGWDAARKSLVPAPLIGQTANDEGQKGYAWQSDGILHLHGNTLATEVTFAQGDIVGLSMDLDRQLLTWYRNGKPALTAAAGLDCNAEEVLTMGEDGIVMVTLEKQEEFDLIPACCLYSNLEEKPVMLQFNFAGKAGGQAFATLPPGHDPYGGID